MTIDTRSTPDTIGKSPTIPDKKPLMDPMPPADALSSTTGETYDDLEAINGIGPAYAKALNAMGIKTYAELAAFDSAGLARKFADETDVRIPAQRIDAADWIGQAAKLGKDHRANGLTAKPSAVPSTDMTSVTTVDRSSDQPSAIVTSQSIGPSTNHWAQQAGFSIFFDKQTLDSKEDVKFPTRWRTRVYHDESGEEIQLDRLDVASWSSWILALAGLTPLVLDERFARDGSESSASMQSNVAIEITQIDVSAILDVEDGQKSLLSEMHFQVHAPAETSRDDAAAAQAEGPLESVSDYVNSVVTDNVVTDNVAAENLPDLKNEAIHEERVMPCRVDIHAVDLLNGNTDLLASQHGDVNPGLGRQTMHHRFVMPAPGRYDLQYVIQLDVHDQSGSSVLVSQRGPRLKVVA